MNQIGYTSAGLSVLLSIVAFVVRNSDPDTAKWMALTAVGLAVISLAAALIPWCYTQHKARHRKVK